MVCVVFIVVSCFDYGGVYCCDVGVFVLAIMVAGLVFMFVVF